MNEKKKEDVIKPRAGAEMVLALRRGRVFTDKKKAGRKYACRRNKGKRKEWEQ